MTRARPTDPNDLPHPDRDTLRAAFLSGAPLTVWRVGVVADPTQAMRHGLNGQPTRTGGAGWLHSTMRLDGTTVLLLVGNGQSAAPGWRDVASVAGNVVTWRGLGEVNPVQAMRERLAGYALTFLGYRLMVNGSRVEATLLDTDRVLVGATCQRDGCHRPLTTPESVRTGYGPTCGGRVKAPRSWSNVNMAEAMRARLGLQ